METPRRKRLGRPPKRSDKIKGIRLDMRLEVTEKDAFRAAAELSGLDLSAWIRERLRNVARKELESAGRKVAFLSNLDAFSSERLVDARLIRPGKIALSFGDGFKAEIKSARLGMPVGKIQWNTVEASPDGVGLTVKAMKGEAIPIASGRLRYLVDSRYAAAVSAKLARLQSVIDEVDEGQPPTGFGQPEKDPILDSWK